MKKLLKGKVCLVTGTSRGIGAEIVRRFVEEGAIVYANALKDKCIDERSDTWNKTYDGTVIPVYFDVTDSNAVKLAIMRIRKEYGRLDVLVNNAGIMQDAVIGMISKELMQNIFNINVFAVMELIQMANKLMSRNKAGSIINISSIVGVVGNAGQLVYSASKGAVISITKTAAKELAINNIRVNAIAPGMIDTDMFRSIGQERIDNYMHNIKMGRLGTTNDIANTAVFLASDMSNYITGQIIGVDGETII